MKILTLNTAKNIDKELKEILLKEIKAFKEGKGRFLQNNRNRQVSTWQFA